MATALADLLPEAQTLVGDGKVLEVAIAALAGYLVLTLVEAFIHQASFEHEHRHEPVPPDGSAAPAPVPTATLLGLLPPASLLVHSTLDGLAIGVGFQAGTNIGVIVLLAVLAHDFADGMNVVTLALDAARGVKLAVAFLALDAVAPVMGAGLSLLISIPPAVLGLLLAWFAGVHRDRRRSPLARGPAPPTEQRPLAGCPVGRRSHDRGRNPLRCRIGMPCRMPVMGLSRSQSPSGLVLHRRLATAH